MLAVIGGNLAKGIKEGKLAQPAQQVCFNYSMPIEKVKLFAEISGFIYL